MTNMYNPNGASFHNKLPMKSIDRLKELDSIEDIGRYKIDYALSTYYPPRCTPSIDVNLDSEIPIVMCAGDIVAIKDVKPAVAYAADDDECGVLEDGDVAVSQNVSTGDAMKVKIDLLYPKDMSGFIVKANGGIEATDVYSENDVKFGVLLADGSTPIAGTSEYVRSANKPSGIVGQRVNSDMKHRFLNYDVKTSGYSIMPAGVITLPVVLVYGSGDTEIAEIVGDIKKAVDPRHQYILFTGATHAEASAKAAHGTKLKSDLVGKFVEFDESTDDDDQYFAKILEKRLRVPYDMKTVEDSFPGSQIPGMDTAGLSKRLYTFMMSAIAAAGATIPSKDDLKNNLYTTTGYVTKEADVSIAFSNVDVVFGYLAK